MCREDRALAVKFRQASAEAQAEEADEKAALRRKAAQYQLQLQSQILETARSKVQPDETP